METNRHTTAAWKKMSDCVLLITGRPSKSVCISCLWHYKHYLYIYIPLTQTAVANAFRGMACMWKFQSSEHNHYTNYMKLSPKGPAWSKLLEKLKVFLRAFFNKIWFNLIKMKYKYILSPLIILFNIINVFVMTPTTTILQLT